MGVCIYIVAAVVPLLSEWRPVQGSRVTVYRYRY